MEELNNDVRSAVRASFEARDYAVEFKVDHVLVTKDGKTTKITNETVMQYIRAFNPEE